MLHYGENDVLLYIFVCADKCVCLLFLGECFWSGNGQTT